MFKRKENGQIMLLLLVIVFVASFLLAGGVFPKKGKISVPNEKLVAENKKASGSEESLQLDKIAFMTVSPSPSPAPTSPPPPPGGPPPPDEPPPPPQDCSQTEPPPGEIIACNVERPVFDGCYCTPPYYLAYICASSKECIDNYAAANNAGLEGCKINPPITTCDPSYASDPKCKLYCIAKPIIYLYPLEKTLVNVNVETPGKVVISDPNYPLGGWKNVLAYPNGDLFYQNKKYRELYYETSVNKVNPPKNGIIIPKEKIEAELKTATTKLGLNTFEQKEFLDYWLPELRKLNSPYILFSVLEKDEKERVDHVVIIPEPQTRIEFLAYFKPLNTPIDIVPLIFPSNPPERIGFTAVEWGGVIEQDK